MQIFSHAYPRDQFISHPAIAPVQDDEGNWQPGWAMQIINGKRTLLIRNLDLNESGCFVADLSQLQDLYDENTHLVTVYTIEQLFSSAELAEYGYRRQAVDADGLLLTTTELRTVTSTERVQVGVNTITHTTVKQKQQHPDWSFELVQNRIDINGDGVLDQYTEGFHKVWTFNGTPEEDADGNLIYPPKYQWVDVEVELEEPIEEPIFEDRETTSQVEVTVPVWAEWEADPEARAVYDRLYPRTPYDVTDEQGNVIETVTPRLIPDQFRIQGHL